MAKKTKNKDRSKSRSVEKYYSDSDNSKNERRRKDNKKRTSRRKRDNSRSRSKSRSNEKRRSDKNKNKSEYGRENDIKKSDKNIDLKDSDKKNLEIQGGISNTLINENLLKINLKDVNLINYPMNTEEEELIMKKALGIDDFDTTKNKSHVDTDLSGVFKGSKVKRKYRQYMNRRGGFNRSLDKID